MIKPEKKLEVVYRDINEDLINLCCDGDEHAQYKLYKLYSKAMYNVALRIVNDPADAEDVLQEAFINAFTNIRSYGKKASFGSWLKRIVINKALNFVNAKKWHFDDLDHRSENIIDEGDHKAEDEDYKVWQIKNAMKTLPNGFRMVLSLYLFEGYDHKEIAEIMNITESTSKSQYKRAKDKLRSLLKTEN